MYERAALEESMVPPTVHLAGGRAGNGYVCGCDEIDRGGRGADDHLLERATALESLNSNRDESMGYSQRRQTRALAESTLADHRD